VQVKICIQWVVGSVLNKFAVYADSFSVLLVVIAVQMLQDGLQML
jgi:hypothetical protein